MPHLTKPEIEKKLLSGETLSWTDAGLKNLSVTLTTPAQRRLLEYLLASSVRQPTSLPESFVTGLQNAFEAQTDPATATKAPTSPALQSTSWRLQAIESDGFGGLNVWNGKTFRYEFDGHSYLLEGPNGSGKSSLTGAIIWALTGERPRDQAPIAPHIAKPVFDAAEQLIGNWPPIATYPLTPGALKTTPKVRVTLTFVDSAGNEATVEKRLNGTAMETDWDPKLDFPSVLLEAGLLMPSRLAILKLNEDKGNLTDSVQKLTGLDDLVALGLLCDGLCHASREYRSFKKNELKTAITNFNQFLTQAGEALKPVSVVVDKFVPANTNEPDGPMAKFGKMLTERAQELTSVVAGDLSSSLDLSKIPIQTSVVTGIAAAEEDVKAGLGAFSTWKILKNISSSLDEEARARIHTAIDVAKQAAQEAESLRNKGTADSRLQLKALAAKWHSTHATGQIENCPLCLHTLSGDPGLAKELEDLKKAGEAASRSYTDNINRIIAALKQSIPKSLSSYNTDSIAFDPHIALSNDAKETFCSNEKYSHILVSLVSHVNTRLAAIAIPSFSNSASNVGSSANVTIDKEVTALIAHLERLLTLADWQTSNAPNWESWWSDLSHGSGNSTLEAVSDHATVPECLSLHLERLSNALQKAEPYRKAAKALRDAWKEGIEADKFQKIVDKREEITTELQLLRSLGSLSESIARNAIQQLSARMGEILQGIHITETLRYREARLIRKEGLVVRAGFEVDLRIDATLVANTSWLRAVLWSFILALREEAVKQLGHDLFPILVFDDPQATFDFTHRNLWANYIAGLQASPAKTQVILTSYDEAFLYFIKINGIIGREAMIVSAGPEFEHISILEGSVLDRAWKNAEGLKTPQGGRDYMATARVYIEGMLKLMLRGEIPKPNDYALGTCRAHIERLQSRSVSPWNHPDMLDLVKSLNSATHQQIKHLEISHHSSGAHLGMSEATSAKSHLSKVLPLLETCFRIVRMTRALHGGQKALHKASPIVQLPEGYKAAVRSLPLQVWGRAAALTDGRAADGVMDVSEYSMALVQKITLAQHEAFILNAPTLEPVARSGDILIVHESEDPSVHSLVCAIDHNQIVARRFALAAHDSEVAVLSAQAVNPFQLAAPVVAQRATLHIRKIVGVLYRPDALDQGMPSPFEVAQCKGETAISIFGTDTLGLVEVVGRSAEPYALNGQHLLVRKQNAGGPLEKLEGRPVIAGDTDGHTYFKRLRLTEDRVVLESLDVSGEHGPIVVGLPGGKGNTLTSIWLVVGVLFELPGQKKQ